MKYLLMLMLGAALVGCGEKEQETVGSTTVQPPAAKQSKATPEPKKPLSEKEKLKRKLGATGSMTFEEYQKRMGIK